MNNLESDIQNTQKHII